MMYKLLTIVFLFCATEIAAQQLTPVLGPLVPVTTSNAFGSTRPRIVLISDTIPLVVWTKTGSGNGIVYSAKWNGLGFDTPIQVSPSGISAYCTADEGGNVAARGDTVFVVFHTNLDKVYAVRSVDGGTSWGDTVRVDHQTVDGAYTPDVEILPGGNPVVLFEVLDATMSFSAQMVCRSTDGGLTFSSEVSANGAAAGMPCECCPPALLVADSMVYALYRDNVNNRREIVFTISSDTGATFPTVSEIDQTAWTLAACPASGPEGMFYQDSIVAVWKSSNRIYFGCGHATNGVARANSILEPTLSSSVLQKHPSVCGNGDTIVFTWSDRRTNSYDVYVAVTSNGPASITLPVLFNDTVGTAENGTQQNPYAIYKSGNAHLIYSDVTTGIVYYRNCAVVSPLSVQENSSASSVQIYPIPATNEFSFEISHVQSALVNVYSITGGLVLSYDGIASNEKMDCGSLARGVYSVVVIDEVGNTFTSQLVKE